MRFTGRIRNLYYESNFYDISIKNSIGRKIILPIEAIRTNVLCNGCCNSYRYIRIYKPIMSIIAYDHALENCRLNMKIELISRRSTTLSKGEYYDI